MSMKAMQKEEFLIIREFAAGMKGQICFVMITNKSQSYQSCIVIQETFILQPSVSALLQKPKKKNINTMKVSLNSQAISNAYSLVKILLPDEEESYDELELWKHVKFRLSPGDRWDQNGVINKLSLWSKSDDNVFFVVGPCGTKDTWVTHFSIDLISMLQRDREVVTFALCDRPRKRWTPAVTMKNLTRQLVEHNPILTLQHAEICNAPTFQRTKEFSQIWNLFWRLAARLESLYIVIDRLDLCKRSPSKESNDEADLLHNLVKIGREMGGKVKIIITSAKAPANATCEKLRLCYTLINTQKRPKQRKQIEEDSSTDSSSSSD